MGPADDNAERLARLFIRMDGADCDAALAAKNDAARLLTAAQLNFKAIAEQIEQRRLLLPPDIIAAIKRMDLPGEGDAAFVGTRKLLTRAKLSFQYIAEALEHASVSPAEHAALARELAALRNIYLRQQSTIAGLKLMLGPAWLGDFLQRAWPRMLLLSAALAVAAVLFSAGRMLADFAGNQAQALGRTAQAVLQPPSSPPAAPPEKPPPPPIAVPRGERAASPQSRSLSNAPARHRVEQITDDDSERPRFQARSNCWGGVGDCAWGGLRSY